MSPKTAFVFCLLVMTICILHVEAAPTCAEPTCGGTRQAAPGEGGEGGWGEREGGSCIHREGSINFPGGAPPPRTPRACASAQHGLRADAS